ncbi:leucine efflux protein LeuE [Candidatus Pandoraea novymonadis]|uniref:Leucine efflux protein n=1 Tax=Candidatus Pandoraea novymonadis TaxID=1808959 RepID=A0ABX5FG30_9BURK|nr:leucine efflux protein LeuE [Candidatus Pandoraea novymonadis]PSB92187.1 Leucine efflux protein [Candidatus Pandoraea novymonadis]
MFFESLGVINIGTYLAGVVVIVLLPGPNSFYVLSASARHGVRLGYLSACAVFVGDAVLMALSAAGAASLLNSSPTLFLGVKSLGAAYLFWMGFSMLRDAWRNMRQKTTVEATEQVMDNVSLSSDAKPGLLFRRSLMISLLNPKAILFFVSFFIQFVDPSYAHPVLSFAVLGAILQCFSFLYLSMLILAGARLAKHFRERRRLNVGATGGVGALFVGFSVKLASATLN